jgi:hypothetical protein
MRHVIQCLCLCSSCSITVLGGATRAMCITDGGHVKCKSCSNIWWLMVIEGTKTNKSLGRYAVTFSCKGSLGTAACGCQCLHFIALCLHAEIKHCLQNGKVRGTATSAKQYGAFKASKSISSHASSKNVNKRR